MLILVINAGSSSIKFSVFCERESDLQLMLHGEFDGMNREPQLIVKNAHGATVEDRKWSGADTHTYDVATEKLLELVREHLDGAAIDAVGHRVVHGGDVFSAPTLVSDEVLRALEQLDPGVLLYLMDELKMDARAGGAHLSAFRIAGRVGAVQRYAGVAQKRSAGRQARCRFVLLPHWS